MACVLTDTSPHTRTHTGVQKRWKYKRTSRREQMKRYKPERRQGKSTMERGRQLRARSPEGRRRRKRTENEG